MRSRHQLWAVANLLVGRYGGSAAVQAEANAVTARSGGDQEIASMWAEIATTLRRDGGDHPMTAVTHGASHRRDASIVDIAL